MMYCTTLQYDVLLHVCHADFKPCMKCLQQFDSTLLLNRLWLQNITDTLQIALYLEHIDALKNYMSWYDIILRHSDIRS